MDQDEIPDVNTILDRCEALIGARGSVNAQGDGVYEAGDFTIGLVRNFGGHVSMHVLFRQRSVFFAYWDGAMSPGYVEFDALDGPWRKALEAIQVAHA